MKLGLSFSGRGPWLDFTNPRPVLWRLKASEDLIWDLWRGCHWGPEVTGKHEERKPPQVEFPHPWARLPRPPPAPIPLVLEPTVSRQGGDRKAMSVCPMKLQKEPRPHLQHWGLHPQVFRNNPPLPDPSFLCFGETKAQRERTCPQGGPPANHSPVYLPERVIPPGDTEQTTEGVQLVFRPPPRLGCVPETLRLFWESQRDSRCILPGSASQPSAAENSRCGPGPFPLGPLLLRTDTRGQGSA